MGVGILSKKLFTKLCIWCEAVGGGGGGWGWIGLVDTKFWWGVFPVLLNL